MMRTFVVPAVVGWLLIMAVVAPVTAQSLAEVVRQEEARRAWATPAAKTYTNADLTFDKTAPDAARSDPPPSPAVSAPSGLAEAEVMPPVPARPTHEPLDEQVWRRRAAEYRAKIVEARKQVAALADAKHEHPREQAMLEALRKRRETVLDLAEDAQRLFEMQADAAKVPKAWIQ